MGGATRKYAEERGMQHRARDIVYNLMKQMYTFVQLCVQKLCSQFVYGGVNEQRH